MKHRTLILNLCIATLIATTPPARAAPRDISAEIAALRPKFVSAKVFHVADSLRGRVRFEEERVAQGCFYPASGDDLSALLDVLVTGGLKETSRMPDGFDETRTIVYLDKRNGGTVPLLLDTRRPGVPSYGSYDRSVQVTAEGVFSTGLHAWMAPRTEINPETSRPCTGFIKFD